MKENKDIEYIAVLNNLGFRKFNGLEYKKELVGESIVVIFCSAFARTYVKDYKGKTLGSWKDYDANQLKKRLEGLLCLR